MVVRVAGRMLSVGGGRLDTVVIGLIFGGAVGNLIDRARFGAVVDFDEPTPNVPAAGWLLPAGPASGRRSG